MITTLQQTVTPASAYTAGNAVGGKIALAALLPAGPDAKLAIVDIVLLDKSAQAVAYDLLFFDADLAGTIADKTAFAIAAADLAKSLGHLSLSGLVNLGANGGIISLSNIYKRLSLPAGGLWGVLVARGTPTYAGASDLSLRITTEVVWG